MTQTHYVLVTKKRTVHTYAELWHASGCMLENGQRTAEGSTWQFLSSTLLTAFTFEAYLNHIGPTLFRNWDLLDRLPPWSKFELLCEKLGVSFHTGRGARPLQTISELLNFRNTIAHGRTVELEVEPQKRTVDNYYDALRDEPLTDWEALIKDETFVCRARTDVDAVLRQLNDARPEPKDGLFTFGFGAHGANLVIDGPA